MGLHVIKTKKQQQQKKQLSVQQSKQSPEGRENIGKWVGPAGSTWDRGLIPKMYTEPNVYMHIKTQETWPIKWPWNQADRF